MRQAISCDSDHASFVKQAQPLSFVRLRAGSAALSSPSDLSALCDEELVLSQIEVAEIIHQHGVAMSEKFKMACQEL